MMVIKLCLVLCLVLLIRVEGSIYPVSQTIQGHTPESFLKAIPMYAKKDSPWWFSLHDPYIRINGKISYGSETLDKGDVVQVIHAWSEKLPNFDMLIRDNYECGSQPGKGDFDGFTIETISLGDGDNVVDLDIKFPIDNTAWHVIIATNCQNSPLEMEANFEFMNPYGQLNGWSFEILPINFFLSMGYFFLGLVYVYKVVVNCQHVLKLQYAIVIVILMGFVERFTWFMTYLEINISGSKICCPVRADITFSLALAVLKRVSGAILLLLVACGFGIVKPKLDRSTNIKIIILGVIYTASSLNLELEKVADISKNGRQTNHFVMSSLIVSICDVIILFWIYFAMSDILADLREGQQLAKLSMYQSIARALAIWSVVWCLFTLGEVLVQGNIDEAWRWWSFLASFWDIFFLGILIQICYIWMPSEMSSQYAYSHQLPTKDDLDEFDQVGLEMQVPDGPESADFVIDNDDDDDDDDQSDDEISLDGIQVAKQ